MDGGADELYRQAVRYGGALRRRTAGGVAAQEWAGAGVSVNGALSLNPATYQVEIIAEGRQVALSNKEFAVLQALLARPGVILSRSDLEDKIYGWARKSKAMR